MSGTIFTPPRFIPVNGSGRPYPGAKLYFYQAGTTTLATVYTTSALAVESANPLTANASGMFDAAYLNPNAGYDYKAVLKNSAGSQLWSEDNIPASAALSSAAVGAALYPKTDAEEAAVVTVVDYTYPPGEVLRYGVNTTPGTTDMTAAIQAAIDQRAQGGAIPTATGEFKCTATIYITGDCNFADAVFNFGTNWTSKAVVVSPEKSATPSSQLGYAVINLPEVRHTKSATGWAGVAGSTGVYIVNVWQSKIRITGAWYFETGVHFYGYNYDVTYNEVSIGTLHSNKVQLKLSWNTAGTGSCNQNVFTGGRFHIDSAEVTTPGSRVTGTKLVYLYGSASAAPNGNTFVGLSLEGIVDEYAVHIEGGGVYNTFVGCRFEDGSVSGKTILLDGTNCRWNNFIGGYGLGTTSVTFSEANSASANAYFAAFATRVDTTSTTNSAIAARNSASNAYPAVAAYAIGDDMTDRADYTVALRGTGIGVKNGDNNTADLLAITNNGKIELGDGTSAADVVAERIAAGALGFSTGTIALKDGMTAPSATTGYAKLYVDTADGSLKVIFGSGTVKTITTDP